MSLKTYRQKRNFKTTAEPAGKVKNSKSKNLYLIQKHAASRLHYDFRIELNGTLKSWAVPKGPCLDPTVKRLAVHVEDHPIEYGSFEGTIPKGQYGGGTVMLWDTGSWQADDENPTKAYAKGDLKFTLQGEKLKGQWKLIRIQKDPKNWLLIKVRDKYAKAEPYDITEKKSRSVLSKKSLEQIPNITNKVWNSAKKSESTPTAKKAQATATKKKAKSALPSLISPQLAALVDTPPAGDQWLHEIKFDGYRLLCFIKNGKVSLITRGQQNWTHKFPTIADAIEDLNLPDAILDGEVVALDEQSQSNFQLLQNHLRDKNTDAIVYYIFDLIYYDNENLSQQSLLERKKQLRKLLPNKKNSLLQFSDHVIGAGDQIFKKSCELHLEGIVSKKIDSFYHQKRTRDWLKVKCLNRQEFVIGGYTQPNGARRHFGSLLIGVYNDAGEFIYSGHVGTGFSDSTLTSLAGLLKKNKTGKMPFNTKPPAIHNVTWVKPTLVAEVEFTEWTRDGILRHPSFKGLRKDKSPRVIRKETVDKLDQKKSEKPIKQKRGDSPTMSTSKQVLSHPEKILYPEGNITKADVADYYTAVHKWILPYLAKRPLTLVRCPQGYTQTCFFQKHIEKDSVDSLYTVSIKDKSKRELYPYLKDSAGLIALVQLGVLEIHSWGSHIDDPEKPDVIIFDLDPAPDVAWKDVIKGAKLIHEKLAILNLKSFVKTTGGKGLHVVVPIKRKYSWDEVKDFTRAFADAIVAEHPQHYIATMSKAKRKGKIFIDYLRNGHGATAIAPYSTRARKHATVSVPLAWDELSVKVKGEAFTVKNVPKRVVKLKKDPWKDFYSLAQSLPLKKFKS
jgi:bifunctional non-homologous end joining protein LigD